MKRIRTTFVVVLLVLLQLQIIVVSSQGLVLVEEDAQEQQQQQHDVKITELDHKAEKKQQDPASEDVELNFDTLEFDETMEEILLTLPNSEELQLEEMKNNLKEKRISEEQYQKFVKDIWIQRQKELAQAYSNVQNDAKEVKKHMNTLNDATTSITMKLNALEQLEWLLQVIDNAVDFIQIDGYRDICSNHINSSISSEIRASAAHALGTAVKNQIELQNIAFESGCLPQLIYVLSRCSDEDELKTNECNKAFYAFTAIVRNNKEIQQELSQFPDFALSISQIIKNIKNVQIRSKVIAFLSDMVYEKNGLISHDMELCGLIQQEFFKLDKNMIAYDSILKVYADKLVTLIQQLDPYCPNMKEIDQAMIDQLFSKVKVLEDDEEECES